MLGAISLLCRPDDVESWEMSLLSQCTTHNGCRPVRAGNSIIRDIAVVVSWYVICCNSSNLKDHSPCHKQMKLKSRAVNEAPQKGVLYLAEVTKPKAPVLAE